MKIDKVVVKVLTSSLAQFLILLLTFMLIVEYDAGLVIFSIHGFLTGFISAMVGRYQHGLYKKTVLEDFGGFMKFAVGNFLFDVFFIPLTTFFIIRFF